MGKRIYLAIIWIITLICILVGCRRFTNSFSWGFWGFWGEEKYEQVEDFDTSLKRNTKDQGEKGEHHYEQAFTNLIITCDTADVTIKTGKEFSCKYKISSNANYSFDWKPDNEGTAYITQKNTRSFNNRGCSFEITIPSDVTLSSVTIENAVGDTKISGVHINTVSGNLDVGDFEMKNAEAENVVIDSDTGDVELKHVTFANLTVTADVGNCSVEDINSNDYDLELSADVGEVEVDGEDYRSSYVRDNGKSQKIDITCSVGDVEIN